MSTLFTPVVLTVFFVAIAAIRLQNVGEFHEAGFCSSVRIDCANSHKEFPHGTVTPRGGSEDHSDTSEQSSSTNDRSSNATNAPSSTSSNQPRRRGCAVAKAAGSLLLIGRHRRKEILRNCQNQCERAGWVLLRRAKKHW